MTPKQLRVAFEKETGLKTILFQLTGSHDRRFFSTFYVDWLEAMGCCNKWISVKNPPEQGEEVFICDKDGKRSCAYFHGPKAGFLVDHPDVGTPVFYIPLSNLPQPPNQTLDTERQKLSNVYGD